MKRTPTIAMGMPVYNGGDRLREVLDCLIGQSFRDFTLFISDNASTDSTAEICRERAEQDARIRYMRQPTNIGAEANFRYVFEHSGDAEYFMWAAADDKRSPDFLERNLAFLQSNPDYVASTSPVRFHGGEFDEVAMGDASLDHADPYRRITDFLCFWHSNGRFYSLFRREPLSSWALGDTHYLASDWALITHLAAAGKLNRLDEGWVELGAGGTSNTTDVYARYRQGLGGLLCPLRRFTVDTWRLVRDAGAGRKCIIAIRLLHLNLHGFVHQFVHMATLRWRAYARRHDGLGGGSRAR